MKFSRRGFVKFSAGSALGLGLSGLSVKALSDVVAAATEENYPLKGPESFVNSICQLCSGGCGVTVRKIGARAVRVQGNKTSPINHGGLCPIGVASLQYLYHPERLRFPLKKDGQGWKRISWDQALEKVSSRLRLLREKGESERVAILSHTLGGTFKECVQRLLASLGSSDLIELTGAGDGTEVAVRLMQGIKGRPAYDLAHSNYLLSIGCEILEGWSSPVWAMKSFSQFRGKRPRGRLTYVGPRQSVTASKADRWVPLRAGTEAAFALGIAYVLISERLCDFEFLRSQCSGFENWTDAKGRAQLGFRNMVLEYYPLNRVTDLTGVPTETILGVAREFGGTRPALALSGPVESVTANSVLSALCAHSLNALVGGIDREGGILLQYPGALDPADDVGGRVPSLLASSSHRLSFGEDPLGAFDRALQQKQPYLPSALLMLEADPVYDFPDGEGLAARLRQIPLIVSVSTFMTASSRLADFVLPAAGFLESALEQTTPPGVSFSYEGLAEPVLEPLGESQPAPDVILSLGRALGVDFPEGDYHSLVRERLARLYDQKRGAVAGTVFDQLWHQLMEQSGWWAPTYETAEQLLEQMTAKGGWWDSFYRYEDWSRTLRTASGKFQFHVEELKQLMPPEVRASEPAEPWELPHYEPVAAAAASVTSASRQYPFQVVFFDPLASKSRQPLLPLVREVAGGHAQNKAGLWIEIGPEDASHLGIRSGELVSVESAQSRTRAFAHVIPGMPPGVVNVPRRIAAVADPWIASVRPGGGRLENESKGNNANAGELGIRVRIVRA